MSFIIRLLCVSLFSCSFTIFATSNQFFDPLDGMLDFSHYLSENAYGFLPVPIIITDPAVEGGLGMMGLFFHETQENKTKRLEAMKSSETAAMHIMPPSVSAALGAYTGNDSYFLAAGYMFFLIKVKYVI
jgi:hypothetical protein